MEDKKEDYQYFLNSFYCKGKWGRDPTTGKSVRLQKDFMQINIKHCDTNETELLFIDEPTIDFYVTNDMKKYTYPQMSMELSELHRVRCKYNEKEKVMAEHLAPCTTSASNSARSPKTPSSPTGTAS